MGYHSWNMRSERRDVSMQYLLESNQFVFAVVLEISSKVQSTTHTTKSG